MRGTFTAFVVWIAFATFVALANGVNWHLVAYFERGTKEQILRLKASLSNNNQFSTISIWTKDDVTATGRWYSKYQSYYPDFRRMSGEKGKKITYAIIKPLLLLDTLNRNAPGDHIIYSDIINGAFHPLVSHSLFKTLHDKLLPPLSTSTTHPTCIPGLLTLSACTLTHEFAKHSASVSPANVTQVLASFTSFYNMSTNTSIFTTHLHTHHDNHHNNLNNRTIPPLLQSFNTTVADTIHVLDTSWSLWSVTPATQSFLREWLDLILSQRTLLIDLPFFSVDETLMSLLAYFHELHVLFSPQQVAYHPATHMPQGAPSSKNAPPPMRLVAIDQRVSLLPSSKSVAP